MEQLLTEFGSKDPEGPVGRMCSASHSNELLSVGEAEEDTLQEWVEGVFGPPSPPGWRDESPEESEEVAPLVAFRNVFTG